MKIIDKIDETLTHLNEANLPKGAKKINSRLAYVKDTKGNISVWEKSKKGDWSEWWLMTPGQFKREFGISEDEKLYEAYQKVDIEGLPSIIMKGSAGMVRMQIKKKLKKPDDIKSIEKITMGDMKKYFRELAAGGAAEEEVSEAKLAKLSMRIGDTRMSLNNIVWDIKASGAAEFSKIKQLARSLDDALEVVQTRLRDMGE
jgi:hypothetical protein